MPYLKQDYDDKEHFVCDRVVEFKERSANQPSDPGVGRNIPMEDSASGSSTTVAGAGPKVSNESLPTGSGFIKQLGVLLASVASLRGVKPPILTEAESGAKKRDGTAGE